MNYYVILLLLFFIITTVICYIKDKNFIKENSKYLLIIIGILTLFLLLRSTKVGIDTKNYENIFNYCRDKNIIELLTFGRHEIGYKYYTKFVSLFADYHFFLCITSIITMIGIYFFIKENSKNYFLSVLLFITFNFYGFCFGILRQSLAISILLCGYKYIFEKKIWKFLLFVLLATLFHKTAFIFIILYFIKNIHIDKRKLIIWIGIIVMSFISRQFILNFIINYVYKPADITFYSGSGYKMLILLIGLGICCYFFQDRLLKQDKKNQLLINMIYIASIIQTLSTFFGNTYRVTLYFCYAMLPLVPNIIETIENKKIKMVIEVCMIIILTLYYYFVTSNLIDYVKYEFFWQV